jgi:hypothetical protein
MLTISYERGDVSPEWKETAFSAIASPPLQDVPARVVVDAEVDVVLHVAVKVAFESKILKPGYHF